MTYKELLFKMADKGMLTLSNKKDGRGLFWAGMDNMEALGQKVDLEAMTEYKSDMDTDKMSLTKKEQIVDLNPESLFADGFENALLGYDANSFCAVYDYDKCMTVLIDKDRMSYEEAHEYMEFNVVTAYVGDFTPSFIHTF